MGRALAVLSTLSLVVGCALLAGCVEQSRGAPQMWYAAHDAVAPRSATVSVCHGFGCQLKTSVAFTAADIEAMRRTLGRAGTASAERAGVARTIAWAERRVAPAIGSENDIPGLDLVSAGVAGQMDCIDEAANTTSYLLVWQEHGLLRHHTVGKPVARGFFIDGRYPHATATIVDADGSPWAVDSWPNRNGTNPEMMPLADWFAKAPAWG